MNRKLLLLVMTMGILFMMSCSQETDEVTSATYTVREELPPVPVEALNISKGKLITTVTGSGIIRGAEEAWIVSEASGPITQVFVSPGDYVKAGDPLIKVDDNLTYWDMKRAEQQLKTADFEYKGTKDSFEKGAVSQVEYNRAYSAWFNSKAAFEQALNAYNDCTIKAPISGFVSQMDTTLTQGNILNRGTVVLKVVNLEKFVIEISPGQREVGLIKKDYPAKISIDLADSTVISQGKVLDISAGSNERTGSFPVRVTWDNVSESRILPGMTARVDIETNDVLEGIIIPVDKLIEREGKKWVYLAEDGIVTPREVVLGTRLGNRVVVEQGLTEGEILISSGFSSLAPGYPVALTILGDSGGW
jgi:membrane fusion protein (multidrug efflux system)